MLLFSSYSDVIYLTISDNVGDENMFGAPVLLIFRRYSRDNFQHHRYCNSESSSHLTLIRLLPSCT
jgi:hypothetical protein